MFNLWVQTSFVSSPLFSSFVKAPTPHPLHNRDWGSFKWKPSMHSNAGYQVSHSALGSDSRQSLAGSQSLCRSHGPCLRLRVSWAVGWEEFIFLTAKEAVQQSIRSICLSVCLFVCLCHSWNSSFKRFTSQSEHSLRLTNQSEDSILSAVSADISCSIKTQ